MYTYFRVLNNKIKGTQRILFSLEPGVHGYVFFKNKNKVKNVCDEIQITMAEILFYKIQCQ